MKGAGPVTLAQVEAALENLGGQATWDKILAEVTKLRKGDYSYYLNEENYEKTAFQVIQEHCPNYVKYRGTTRFEKIGKTYRLNPAKPSIAQPAQTPPEKHTPRASDIEDQNQPGRVQQETYRILRDTAMARSVKETHQYRCQICGQTLRLGNGALYAEAHHVVPLGTPHNGPDVRDNILCVCPNDHVLLDYGAIKLDETSLDGIGKQFISYHNESIYGRTLV